MKLRWRNEAKNLYGSFFILLFFSFLSVECYDIFLIYAISSQIDAHTAFDVLYMYCFISLVTTTVGYIQFPSTCKKHSSNELIFFLFQQTPYFEFSLLVITGNILSFLQKMCCKIHRIPLYAYLLWDKIQYIYLYTLYMFYCCVCGQREIALPM